MKPSRIATCLSTWTKPRLELTSFARSVLKCPLSPTDLSTTLKLKKNAALYFNDKWFSINARWKLLCLSAIKVNNTHFYRTSRRTSSDRSTVKTCCKSQSAKDMRPAVIVTLTWCRQRKKALTWVISSNTWAFPGKNLQSNARLQWTTESNNAIKSGTTTKARRPVLLLSADLKELLKPYASPSFSLFNAPSLDLNLSVMRSEID